MTNSESKNQKDFSDRSSHSQNFFKYLGSADAWTALATLILAGVGAWGVIETRTALKLSERAWVSPVQAQLIGPLEVGKSIKFMISLMNSGREPAIDTNFMFQNGFIIAPPPDNWSSMVVDKNTTCDGIQPMEGAQAITPSTNGIGLYRSSDSSFGKNPVTVTQALIDGTTHYYVRGCVAYQTFKETHFSGFCFVLKSQPNLEWQKTPFFNCPTGFPAN